MWVHFQSLSAALASPDCAWFNWCYQGITIVKDTCFCQFVRNYLKVALLDCGSSIVSSAGKSRLCSISCFFQGWGRRRRRASCIGTLGGATESAQPGFRLRLVVALRCDWAGFAGTLLRLLCFACNLSSHRTVFDILRFLLQHKATRSSKVWM